MKHQGWILDLYHRNGQMFVWIKKPDGTCLRLVDKWTPRIRVAGDLARLLDLACEPYVANCRIIEKFEEPGDLERTRVLEVETKSDKEAKTIAERIERENNGVFRLYDVDIPALQMYLYEKDLFPFAFVEVELSKGRVFWNLKDSRESLDYSLPPLRKIILEVESGKRGRIRTYDDAIEAIRVTSENGETITASSLDEVENILSLVKIFQEIDPDIVITQGGDSFILPYLARRSRRLGILDQLILDREASPLGIYETQGRSYFSYGKILYRDTATRLFGRLHLDHNNSFISKDCGLEGLFEVSRTCIMPVQRASRATIGTNMTSLQLYHAVKNDVLIPWNKNRPEEWKDAEELIIGDRGGSVFEPEVGIHDRVGELDFSSLYPMIMLRANLSGETVKCICCPDSPQRVPELDYNLCQRWQGIVPRSVDILLRKRLQYKKYMNTLDGSPLRDRFDKCQAALKWILVCS